HNVDVLVLVECPIPEAQMLRGLNRSGTGLFRLCGPLKGQDIQVYSRLPAHNLIPVLDMPPHLSLYQVVGGNGRQVLLAAVHLKSKMWRTDADQRKGAEDVIQEIMKHEGPGKRSIVIGDFNMNPWEEGMINANAFHAVMSRKDAQRNRSIDNAQFSPYYNPMWGLLGDREGRAPSTYRRTGGGVLSFLAHV
ncbi:MAG: hypothetical protein M3Y56_16975, partial [Armatimonadota bacterium]|nr:hypothetical protein [Armatimonadota bacterium]